MILLILIGAVMALGLLDILGRGLRSHGLALAGRDGGYSPAGLGAAFVLIVSLVTLAALAASGALAH